MRSTVGSFAAFAVGLLALGAGTLGAQDAPPTDLLIVTKTADVTVNVSVVGGASDVVVCGAGGNKCMAANIRKGTRLTVTASVVSGKNLEFAHWTGICEGKANPCSVTIDKYRGIGAVIRPIPHYAIKVVPVPHPGTIKSTAGLDCGTSRPGGACTVSVLRGTHVTLTEAPNAGRWDREWTGACAGKMPPEQASSTCELTVTADVTVGATYVPAKRYMVQIDVPHGAKIEYGGGKICQSYGPCEFESALGRRESFHLSVPPLTWNPPSWGGDCAKAADVCTIVISKERTHVSAAFKR